MSRLCTANCLFACFLTIVTIACAASFGPSEVAPGVTVGAEYETRVVDASAGASVEAEVNGRRGFCALAALVGLDGTLGLCEAPDASDNSEVDAAPAS